MYPPRRRSPRAIGSPLVNRILHGNLARLLPGETSESLTEPPQESQRYRMSEIGKTWSIRFGNGAFLLFCSEVCARTTYNATTNQPTQLTLGTTELAERGQCCYCANCGKQLRHLHPDDECMHCEDPFTCSSKSFEESRAGLVFAYELCGRLLGSGDDPTVTDKAWVNAASLWNLGMRDGIDIAAVLNTQRDSWAD
jgi:hypothetical protein